MPFKRLLPALAAMLTFCANAQEALRPATLPVGTTWAWGAPLPAGYTAWQVDDEALEVILADAPPRFPAGADGAWLELPLGAGNRKLFRVFRDPLLPPALAQKFPSIRIYAGHAADNPAIHLRLETGPRGLHAQILLPGEGALYLDPLDPNDPTSALVLYRRADYDASAKEPFRCHTEVPAVPPAEESERGVSGIDGELRVYRLALACTGEYASAVGATTKAQALAAMATSMNRVNGIYERDLGVRMELVAGNDQVVFLNGATDPYDNNDVFAMLDQNQQTCDALIGNAGYDVGHVFSTGGGGVAGLGTPCETGYKANGVTGLSNPKGDGFDIDYVAHEMGHQFGCNHTFNNSCSGNRFGPTAWEPGSGSTIMAYAGICDPNVQNNSDALFHGGSMLEAFAYTVTGPGDDCAQKIPTGNKAPAVNAGPDQVIPRSTPFELEALGSDPEGDSLTYAWEQFENALAPMPPSSTSLQGPLFRSFLPTATPWRVFPNLPAILANQNPVWEVLPSLARTLDFRVTVRDNHPGGGNWNQDALRLTVAGNAGPFVVTQPNGPLLWTVGDTVTVAWNPANTTAPPVSCAAVDIRLSTDGGLTWPLLLAAGVPNDGSRKLVVPLMLPATKCRVKVKGSGNVFFDVSNTNFTIGMPSTPTFLAFALQDSLPYCASGDDTLRLSVVLQPLTGFNGPVSLTLLAAPGLGSDLPASFDLQGKDTLEFRVWGLAALPAGQEKFSLQLSIPSRTRTIDYTLLPAFPLASDPEPIFPSDGIDSVGLRPVLRWTSVPQAAEYRVELAGSPAFGASMVLSATVRDTFLALSADLEGFRTWYWRVVPTNACGERIRRDVWAFRTVGEVCDTYLPTDTPLTIPEGQTFLKNSVVPVAGQGRVSALRVSVDLKHQRLQDITLRLLGPNGSARSVFAKSCPNGQDIQATFRDDGDPFLCASLPPAISGDVMPATGSFANMLGQQAAGNWALRVVDDNNLTGGVLESWSLTLCRYPPLPPAPVLLVLDTLEATLCQSNILSANVLALEDDPVGSTGSILRLAPLSGQLERNGQPLLPGDTLWMTDIAAGHIAYRHAGDSATTDDLLLDAFDLENGGWLPGVRLHIRIGGVPTLEATLEEGLRCHGDSNAVIRLGFSGCTDPLEYRLLPDGPWQPDPLFGGLSAGEYRFEARDGQGRWAESQPLSLTPPDPLESGWLLQGDTLTASAQGGTPPYGFSLDGQSGTDGRFFIPASGTYLLRVVDSLGCERDTLLLLELLSGSATAQGVSCQGQADGIILLQAAGGTPPYAYRMDGGPWQPDPVFPGLPGGTYLPELRDATGAVRILQAVTVDEPALLELFAQQTGDSTALLSALGGTPPYTWQLEGGTPQDSALFEGLEPGVRLFFVTDARGCRDSVALLIESSATADPADPREHLSVHPNPGNGLFRISLKGLPIPARLDWTLRDAMGRIVLGGASAVPEWPVDASGFPAGWYWLEVRGEGWRRVVALRKE